METLQLQAMRAASGTVKLPGSKSISNRTFLLAALAEGTTEIRDLLVSDDTARMLEALEKLGVQLEKLSETDWKVTGCGGSFPNKSAELFLGNAGTAFRPLTAALALSGGHYTLSGVPRMHERPIKDLVDALRQIGANIEYMGNEGFPPLKISPANIDVSKPIKIRGDVSSQFLTALLMALPLTGKPATIQVVGELISKPYIEITLNLMAKFGVQIEREGWRFFNVPAHAKYTAPQHAYYVEGDASSASYFLAAGAIAAGGIDSIRVEGTSRNSIQGDIRFAEEIKKMGAHIDYGMNWIIVRAPAGKLKTLDLDCNHIPDAAMTLAMMALFADGTTTLRNIASWRVKETDRIAAMAKELRKVGAIVEEGTDYLKITPPAKLTPNAVIDTYDDHRMAMCFSLVCLGGVPITINDPKCVAKTFPNYFEEFARIVINPIPVIAIDGPSASGKGTVAQRVAQHLGFHYLDSGALYRIVALAAERAGIEWDDGDSLAHLAASLDIAFDGEEILLDGENVAAAVRSEAMGKGASEVAVHQALRSQLLNLQHGFRRETGLVADGRDMGSVVFKDAQTKVFLTASSKVRAERRYNQLIDKGNYAILPHVLADIEERDTRDKARTSAPLIQCADALFLDTSQLTIDEAVQKVLQHYQSNK